MSEAPLDSEVLRRLAGFSARLASLAAARALGRDEAFGMRPVDAAWALHAGRVAAEGRSAAVVRETAAGAVVFVEVEGGEVWVLPAARRLTVR